MANRPSDGPAPSGIDQTAVDVLLQRYEQLNQAHYEHNQVIHTTFHLSVVFFSGLLSIVFTAEPDSSLVPLLSIFAGFVFVLLGVWAWRYNHGREQIKHRQRLVKTELDRYDFSLSDGTSISDTFFVAHGHRADPYKKYIHTAYYLLLAVAAVVLPLVLI